LVMAAPADKREHAFRSKHAFTGPTLKTPKT
jgi:hypothetical protein